MVIKYIKNDNVPELKPSIACIGYFDCVHIGHQKLIKETIKQAKKFKVKSTLICFNPDPVDIITGKKNTHILDYKTRLSNIETYGIDQVLVIKFDKDLMKLSGNSFISKYLNKMNIIKLVCGFDFTFGYKGFGNVETLKKCNKFETIIIDECKYRGTKVSTTRIKDELINGNFKLVNKLLGYDYGLKLKVTNCIKKNGKYLIESKLKDSHSVMPNDKVIDNGFYIKNRKVYIISPTKINKGETLYSIFTYE